MRLLGFIWLLPMTVLVWAVYVLPVWALGWIEYRGVAAPYVLWFELSTKKTFYHRVMWRRFWGWSGPCVMVLSYAIPGPAELSKIRKHELAHCRQQFIWGCLHYPLYGLIFLCIFVAKMLRLTNKHPYRDNPFEVDARRAEFK